MNEAETRAEHIDPALKAAGWGVVEGSRSVASTRSRSGRHRRRGGPAGQGSIADYVLVYRNHKLAVIEAKAWDEPLTVGVGQAKDYAGKMQVRFAYATNGQGVVRHRHGDGGEGGRCAAVSRRRTSCGPRRSRAANALARPVRGRPLPGQERDVVDPLLPGDRRQPRAGADRRRRRPRRC